MSLNKFESKGVPTHRWALLLGLCVYIIWLIFFYRYHFIDNVNLVFHEAGHLFFTPLGRTMHFIGGTVGQLVFPIIATIYFRREKKYFESGVGIIWLGESFLYAAEYMGDAIDQVLPLVGGGIHDWHFLFSQWGVLDSTNIFSSCVYLLGCIILIFGFIVMYRNKEIKKHQLPDELIE